MYDRIVNAEELLIQACIGTQAIDADQATRGSIAGMLTGFIRPYWFGGLDTEMIELRKMTRALCHELYRNWQSDASIYMDMSLFKPYVYDQASVDRYFDAKNESSRILFAIMLDGRPIGELQLKRIDWEKAECTLSIHMQNDAVKGKGYGTQAERLAVQYAFEKLGMAVIHADAVLKNTRSQHVLEKVGFRLVGEDETFKYYRMER